MSIPVRVYKAESQVRDLRTVLREMVQGFASSRYMAYRIARKDIKDTYASSAWGLVWDMLDPLLLAGIFYYLMQTRLINGDDLGMSAAVYVVFGVMLYQCYVDALLLSVDIMNRSKNLLNHLSIPPEALILSVAYRVAFNSLFRIAVMLIFALVSGEFSPLGFLKFLLLFPLIIFWGMAPGILLAPFNVIYNDVNRIVRLCILPLRFLAPVIYAIPAESLLGRLQIINPVTMILENLRSVAVNDTFVSLTPTAIHFAILLLIAFLGCLLFHVAIPILSERT